MNERGAGLGYARIGKTRRCVYMHMQGEAKVLDTGFCDDTQRRNDLVYTLNSLTWGL